MQMEREEGELSDEDLEDVTDNSSMSIISGKSPLLSTNREPLRELSLTSVSDDSEENESVLDKDRSYRILSTRAAREINRNICRRHYKYHRDARNYIAPKRDRRISERRITQSRTNSRKQYSSVSSSSSEVDSYIQDRKILRQLRDAVRISTSKSLPNCSLRTRLKRMIEPDSQGSKNSNSEDDGELEALRDQALQSKTKNDSPADSAKDTITDEDLINLRLIALQSAVMKKHQNRRKRKEEQNKLLEQVAVNGEQDKPDVNSSVCNGEKEQLESTVPDVPGEQNPITSKSETEDIQQIHTQVIIENNDTTVNKDNVNIRDNNNKHIDEDEDILRAMLLTSISKKIASKKDNLEKQQKTELKQTLPLPNILAVPTTKKTVEKNHVIIPSAPINRIIINVNSDSDSDAEQTVVEKKDTNSNVKANDLFDKSLSLFLQQARAKSETEHQSDIAKHLPRSQQLEYKRLKRKLQQMSTKNKLKQTTDVLDENKKIKLTNVISKRIVSWSKPTVNGAPVLKTTEGAGVFSDISEKQVNNVGRVQEKGKYEELTPLMTRVSEAQNARDKAQTQVKQLINDLRIARAALTSTHQTYSVLMQQLVKAKANIDKRLDDQELKNNKTNKIPAICTSTPNKTAFQENPCELSRIDQNVVTQPVEVKNQVSVDVNQMEVVVVVSNCDKDKKQQGTETVEQRMDIDENDGDNQEEVPVSVCVQEKPSQEYTGILRYTSPLDHMQLNREKSPGDPLLVLCPYDLLGECRDPDCSYRHCGNAITD